MLLGLLIALILAFILGLIGTAFTGTFENMLLDSFGTRTDFSQFHDVWWSFIEFFFILLIPLSVFLGIYMIYNRQRPEKLGDTLGRVRNFLLIIVLMLASMMIYTKVANLFDMFPNFLIASFEGFSGFEDMLYETDPVDGVSIWNIGSIGSTVLRNILLNGLYTLSLMAMVAAMVVRKILLGFGVVLFPAGLFVYGIPFKVADGWGIKIIRDIFVLMLLPVLNIILLATTNELIGDSFLGKITHISVFAVLALVNFGFEKQFIFGLLNFNPNGFRKKQRRRKRKYRSAKRGLGNARQQAANLRGRTEGSFGKIRGKASGINRPSISSLTGGSSSSSSTAKSASNTISDMRKDVVGTMRKSKNK